MSRTICTNYFCNLIKNLKLVRIAGRAFHTDWADSLIMESVTKKCEFPIYTHPLPQNKQNKLGLNWAKLNWNWDSLQLRFAALMITNYHYISLSTISLCTLLLPLTCISLPTCQLPILLAYYLLFYKPPYKEYQTVLQ